MYVADYNKSRIYQMNNSADITATYDYDLDWQIGSLAIDANSPSTFEDPSILYGLSSKTNDSGLMYRRNISGSVPELIREFPGK